MLGTSRAKLKPIAPRQGWDALKRRAEDEFSDRALVADTWCVMRCGETPDFDAVKPPLVPMRPLGNQGLSFRAPFRLEITGKLEARS